MQRDEKLKRENESDREGNERKENGKSVREKKK
jgi:hypothetical protein